MSVFAIPIYLLLYLQCIPVDVFLYFLGTGESGESFPFFLLILYLGFCAGIGVGERETDGD